MNNAVRAGRYLEADLAGVIDGTNHLYVYAQNNPLVLVDLYGYAPGHLFPTAEIAAFDAIDYSRSFTDSAGIEYCGWVLKTDCLGQET